MPSAVLFAVNLSPFYDKKKQPQTDSSLHDYSLNGKFSKTIAFCLLS